METQPPTATDLYELDFFEWTLRNAELLRASRLDEADLGHIAGEMVKKVHRARC